MMLKMCRRKKSLIATHPALWAAGALGARTGRDSVVALAMGRVNELPPHHNETRRITTKQGCQSAYMSLGCKAW